MDVASLALDTHQPAGIHHARWVVRLDLRDGQPADQGHDLDDAGIPHLSGALRGYGHPE